MSFLIIWLSSCAGKEMLIWLFHCDISTTNHFWSFQIFNIMVTTATEPQIWAKMKKTEFLGPQLELLQAVHKKGLIVCVITLHVSKYGKRKLWKCHPKSENGSKVSMISKKMAAFWQQITHWVPVSGKPFSFTIWHNLLV